MFRFGTSVPFCLFILGSASLLSAATPVIGVAASEGSILLNDAKTAGNATVFDGNTVQTQRDLTQVKLKDGAQVQLAPESRGRLYSDHLNLEKGAARISDYAAIAKGLNVRADHNSSAAVSMKGDMVEVAALSGDVRVFNSSGLMVAKVLPGRALDLRPQEAGAAAPSTLTGCVVRNGDTYLLTDETSDVTVQLRGGNLHAGERVQVTGTVVPNITPPAGASQVLQVTDVRQVGGTCVAGVAGTTPGSGSTTLSQKAWIAGVTMAVANAIFVYCATVGCGSGPSSPTPISGGLTPTPF